MSATETATATLTVQAADSRDPRKVTQAVLVRSRQMRMAHFCIGQYISGPQRQAGDKATLHWTRTASEGPQPSLTFATNILGRAVRHMNGPETVATAPSRLPHDQTRRIEGQRGPISWINWCLLWSGWRGGAAWHIGWARHGRAQTRATGTRVMDDGPPAIWSSRQMAYRRGF